MDYDSLIDAETWAFIRATEAHFPPDAADIDIAEQRRRYDLMCVALRRDYPPGIAAEDRLVAGVSCRVFAGAGGSILYLHG